MRGYSDGFKEGLANAKIALAPFAAATAQVDPDMPDLKDTHGWTFQAIDFRRASAAFNGETGMVPVTGKERPMLRPEAASTEARFETASLHQCPYCGDTEGLRLKCDGGGYAAPEYTCEACFTGTDDGPCFDDLPSA
jgi:predicted RNA-binding Zn-ribbon protein involved in translation (DUF1610 family)